MSKSAKKKAKKKVKQEQKREADKKALADRSKLLALTDIDRGNGGKGGGKAGKGAQKSKIPKGIKAKLDNGKFVCYGYCLGEKCAQNPCPFVHVCWWCGGDHPGGDASRPNCQK